VKAGVTRRQVEEVGVGLAAEGQIKLAGLFADALQDDLLGFHLARDADLREIGLLYYVLNSSDRLGDAEPSATAPSSMKAFACACVKEKSLRWP
jgi:hypothetical protein